MASSAKVAEPAARPHRRVEVGNGRVAGNVTVADQHAVTLLETAFPYADVSRLVAADRRSRDTAYQAHRWWARRPPALVRGVLLAAALPASTDAEAFRAAYGSETHRLDGWRVLDAFAGGGTTLVEAARLGAVAVGRDVDPLAVLLNRHQLAPSSAADLRAAAARLAAHLQTTLGHLWPVEVGGWQPLHYFTVAQVQCPECAEIGLLYRSLVLARSDGKAGSVVREAAVTAFCPDCLQVKSIGASATTIMCCRRRRTLASGTYRDGRYRCPGCALPSDHAALQTGAAPRALVGVEETPAKDGPDRRRRIRSATPGDLTGEAAARVWLDKRTGPALPLDRSITVARGDRRPVIYGITTIGMLHTARQAAYLAAAHDWINDAALPDQVARGLRLAVSSTVSSNNRLCGYATDYGRLAPLFSVRAFSLPTLAVELNPLSTTGGRGTLAAAVTRVAKSCEQTVRRHVLDETSTVTARAMTLTRFRDGHRVDNGDSAAPGEDEDVLADICLTDPPYYDFIPYDTLSQVFRAWLPEQQLAGDALLPCDKGVEPFGRRLGASLRRAADGLKPGALLAFTYKGGTDAWDAVGVALDEAKMLVTALWPVLADPHMGHHSGDGNCEYDVLVVARRVEQAVPAQPTAQLDEWLANLPPGVSRADRKSMAHAVRVAGPRWGAAACD